MKKGDLVRTHKGNACVILDMEELGLYLDVLFLRTGHIRTGFHRSKIREVISVSVK